MSDKVITKLGSRNIKPTPNRILVLDAMMSASSPVSLADLECILETVDKSSIFRTMNLFLAHHLVHVIDDGSGSLKYEVCTGEENELCFTGVAQLQPKAGFFSESCISV